MLGGWGGGVGVGGSDGNRDGRKESTFFFYSDKMSLATLFSLSSQIAFRTFASVLLHHSDISLSNIIYVAVRHLYVCE